jgi:hypothetical protein
MADYCIKIINFKTYVKAKIFVFITQIWNCPNDEMLKCTRLLSSWNPNFQYTEVLWLHMPKDSDTGLLVLPSSPMICTRILRRAAPKLFNCMSGQVHLMYYIVLPVREIDGELSVVCLVSCSYLFINLSANWIPGFSVYSTVLGISSCEDRIGPLQYRGFMTWILPFPNKL